MTATIFLDSHLFFWGAHTSTIVALWSGCTLQVRGTLVKTTAPVGYSLPSLTQAIIKLFKIIILLNL